MIETCGPDSPLRCLAERLWEKRPATPPPDMPTRGLLQELEIHQIELELQNAELRRSQAEAEQARAAAEAALERYAQLYDFAPVAYFTFDPAGTILKANFAAARLLGIERSRFTGRRFGIFVATRHRHAFAHFLAGAFGSQGRQACIVDLERPDGVPILAGIVADPAEPGGECRAVAEDITERERAREELEAAKAEAERANQAKSRFLAAASHDLRQPLQALGFYLSALRRRLDPGEQRNLQRMETCLVGLGELLSRLLDLSKLEAGAVKPEARDFPLDDLLRRLVTIHAPAAESKAVSLRYRPTLMVGNTDSELLGRVIGNLLDNAVRYTGQGGVLLGCRRRGGKVSVEVWDTGIGLRGDQISDIFEEFRQLGNAQRNADLGHGLGLSIAAKTAALLGLEIRVRSRPGRGSLFAVELPMGGAPEPAAQYGPQVGRPLRIALVEDDNDVRKSLVFALEGVGHRLLAAASSDELLARLARVPPDMVIADHRLAGNETGFDAIRSVRAAFGERVPALILTGDTDPQVIREMADQGIPVKYKPLDLSALMDSIAELTGAADRMADPYRQEAIKNDPNIRSRRHPAEPR
jgi:PAS domain S-box-containing protein